MVADLQRRKARCVGGEGSPRTLTTLRIKFLTKTATVRCSGRLLRQSGGSEATLELKDHVDGLTGLHIVRLNCVLVGERLSLVDEANHGHVDALTLLQRLLDVQNSVRRLKVERLLDSSERLMHSKERQ